MGFENPIRTFFTLIACIVHINPFPGVEKMFGTGTETASDMVFEPTMLY
jgi:hypothetical protein